MKKIVFVFAIIAVFIGCQSNPKIGTDTATTSTKSDTATLNHNAFTDNAREIQLNGVNDTIVSSDGNTYVKLKPKEAEPAAVKVAEITNKPKAQHSSSQARRARSVGSGAGTSKSENSTVSNGTGSGRIDTAATPTPVTKKKGWSKAAKGAVIGAGSGAAAGAILTKKKGKGAIIGGIIGATGGYIIGRGKDKKDGRY